MTFPLPIPEPLRQILKPGTGVLLGISGGVDSAVTLALLKHLGCEVECVTFKNFCYADGEVDLPEKNCCSLEAIDDARRLARSYGARHWVGNVEDPFRRDVIDPFVEAYSQALTPNPCLDCNGQVRFPELVRLADRHGCDFAATGHYARIGERAGEPCLMEGLDPTKDQSYFLHKLSADLLSRVLFPLGWYVKDDVRRAARELGIPAAAKKDSVEICFVPDGDRSFLFADSPATEPGDIVNSEGRVLGRHRGLIHYTVGQRKGLGVAADRPLYVLRLDLPQRALVVGYQEDLSTSSLEADRFRALVTDLPPSGTPGLRVRVRHRHAGVPVTGYVLDGERLRVDLGDPVDGAAPGQGLVLYQDDVVLGGGRIVDADRAEERTL